MILLCAATEFEIRDTIDYLHENKSDTLDILITGVGCPHSMYSICQYLSKKKPDLIIQAGIAGTFNKKISIGDVVIVDTEQWADLGVEDTDSFYSVFDMKFTNPDDKPYKNGIIPSNFPRNVDLENYKKVVAITSTIAHGNQQSIDRIIATFNPDIETMEGAALAYVAAMKNIPFIQMRSISNVVEPRNKENWNIPLAVKNLNWELLKLVKTF